MAILGEVLLAMLWRILWALWKILLATTVYSIVYKTRGNIVGKSCVHSGQCCVRCSEQILWAIFRCKLLSILRANAVGTRAMLCAIPWANIVGNIVGNIVSQILWVLWALLCAILLANVVCNIVTKLLAILYANTVSTLGKVMALGQIRWAVFWGKLFAIPWANTAGTLCNVVCDTLGTYCWQYCW